MTGWLVAVALLLGLVGIGVLLALLVIIFNDTQGR